MVDARGELPERRFQLTLAGGRVEITERDEAESEPDARVTGPVSAWVHALGPEGAAGDLQITGRRRSPRPCSTASRTRAPAAPPPRA